MIYHIISPTVHSVLDYAMAIALIIAPFTFGFLAIPKLLTAFSVILGVVLLGYSLLTNYPLGIYPGIPFKSHLTLDVLVSFTFFILALFNRNNSIAVTYCCVIGIALILMVALSEPKNFTIG